MNTRTASKAPTSLVVPHFNSQPIWAQDPAEAIAAEPFRIAVTKDVSRKRGRCPGGRQEAGAPRSHSCGS